MTNHDVDLPRDPDGLDEEAVEEFQELVSVRLDDHREVLADMMAEVAVDALSTVGGDPIPNPNPDNEATVSLCEQCDCPYAAEKSKTGYCRTHCEHTGEEISGAPSCTEEPTMGAIAFAAYNKSRGGVNFRGDKTPDWSDLPEEICLGWEEAADEVLRVAEKELLSVSLQKLIGCHDPRVGIASLRVHIQNLDRTACEREIDQTLAKLDEADMWFRAAKVARLEAWCLHCGDFCNGKCCEESGCP